MLDTESSPSLFTHYDTAIIRYLVYKPTINDALPVLLMSPWRLSVCSVICQHVTKHGLAVNPHNFDSEFFSQCNAGDFLRYIR